MAADPPTVEIVYALPDREASILVEWRPALTAQAAVDESGLLDQFLELSGKQLILGVFGRPVDGTTALEPGDRVEIGRPLRVDPRTARRETARALAEAQERGSGSTSRSTRTTRSPSK